MRFEFGTAGRILFGPGTMREIPALAKSLGKRALVVSGQGGADPASLIALLEEADISVCPYAVAGEPTIQSIVAGVGMARSEGVDFLIGYGGGSAIDTGKAISILLTNPGNLEDYLEVIGKGLALQNPPLSYIAVPTTAGTGSEVTRNAVIASPEYRMKLSLRSPLMLPRIAVVDAELTYTLPPAITAVTGMDAIAQVLEPFVSPRANPLSDGFCRQGLQSGASALRRAYFHGEDSAAREGMAFTSLMGGLALANAGLGAVHGFASPIGGLFPAPHGAICAKLMAPVMEINLRALRERAPDHPALARYREASRILTGNPAAEPKDGVQWLAELSLDLNIPALVEFGVTRDHFQEIAEKASIASSMKANPIQLSQPELIEILEKSI